VPRAQRLAALDAALPLLACPVCAGRLGREDGALACPQGHRFDVARTGTVNLAGRAAPRNADTPAMVAARESFLATAAYRPLADALIEVLTSSDMAGDPWAPRCVAEFGAGPGYYLRAVLDALSGPAVGLAADVSGAAARRAAARGLAAIVADTWERWPLRDACLDAVMCVFAPRNPSEAARVLRPGGRFVLATPQADHLAEVRHRLGLMGVHDDAGGRARAALAHAGLETVAVRPLRYRRNLGRDDVDNLVGMGPNAYHAPPAADAAVRVTVAVEISLCAKAPG